MGTDDATPSQAEPLAKTRTRRSNAGARMHEMMFNAEDDETLAHAYGIIKPDDESSDDEEYVPKDHENDRDQADDGEDDDTSGSDSEDDDDDDDDEEDDDDDEEQQQGEADDDEVTIVGQKRIKLEGVKSESKPGSSVQPGSPNKQAYDACSRICSVCLGDGEDDDNEIIECDNCGVTVHESCYGVPEQDEEPEDNHSLISAESTEPWFCEPCKRSVRNPHCELCPNLGGIFKETDTGRWVHMVCALYTNGVTWNNVETLSEASLFELNYALYGSKACTICEDRRLARSGICIGCDAGLCKTFFHPTCAQKEGLLFESHSDEVEPYFAQCKQHADRSTIRRKKKTCTALFARLKRVQASENISERVKQKLAELNQEPDPSLSKWSPENQPPIAKRIGRMLLTSPAVILKLTRKSELLGLDPNSAFMTIQDEMEMARQKWHIPPAFNLEFVAYCQDRATRIVAMNKKNGELLSQNSALKREEANLRQRYNSLKDTASRVQAEIDDSIKQIRSIQNAFACVNGDSFKLPHQLELLIEKSQKTKSKSPNKNSRSTTKISTTYKCHKCAAVKDQHLLSLCDTCNCYFHIYCLDPPLSRVPKKTKFGGWQCSDCSERDEEEQEEALEDQNEIAIEEANKPRRLRERVNAPDKYCHESMQMADFWSLSKKKSRKSGSSKLKKPKLEVKIEE